MLEFVSASPNLPFTVCILLLLGLSFLELVSMSFGLGISSFLDQMIPEVDFDIDLDVNAEIDHPGLHVFLQWIPVGRVPSLVIIILFLLIFGLIGYGLQLISMKSTGTMSNPWAVSGVCFLISFPLLSITSRALSRIIPGDETSAVSNLSFEGKTAIVTIGEAIWEKSTEAKLQDEHGKTHYLMVSPNQKDSSLKQGDEVVIIEKYNSSTWYAEKIN
ncbi:MAG: DUF1449 family protein [Candidatus Cloacimonetes bacterium]|nr:DUF1449 family protein [Candidatus Cloacimonadota bacterium]